jgi:threonylcarbamoyladenosine tRNA methylthiotransferase MtaB
LGCKLNQAETSALGQRFRAAGFEVEALTDPGPGQRQVVLINSCTVTETAEMECRKLVRRALRESPDAFVIVTGCYAQLRPEEVASIEGVDLVLGSAEKHRALELAGELRKREVPQVLVGELKRTSDFGPAFTGAEDGRTRAFLKVQDGCDYRCSFCTIPAARGPSRSQPTQDAVRQAQSLVDRGFREIVLTGVNVGDYGRKDGSSFLQLLQALHEVQGLARLKISSIEPNLLTDDIIELASRSDRLMPHFHVPLQSGSDLVLRRMRRRYSAGEYAERMHRLAAAIPGVAIGIDVIVGFPGETDEEFAETVAFLQSLPAAYLHVFTYSERPGTPAAEAGAQVDRLARKRRTNALRALSTRLRREFIDRHLGTLRPVLFERAIGEGLWTGLTDNYIRVEVPSAHCLDGQLRTVLVQQGEGEVARAVLVGEAEPLGRAGAAA